MTDVVFQREMLPLGEFLKNKFGYLDEDIKMNGETDEF